MLGSDPISALLGGGVDPRSPKVVWSKYLRHLVRSGCAVAMLGPDVLATHDSDDATLRAIGRLIARYPPHVPMPPADTKALKELPALDVTVTAMASRVTHYYSAISKPLTAHLYDKHEKSEFVDRLLRCGTVTPSVSLHVAQSRLVSVTVPNAEALARWRTWCAEASGDYHEKHSAPTLLLPTQPGGGIFLFRSGESFPELELVLDDIVVSSGNTLVPIPPTMIGGEPVSRLGQCRTLPGWLRQRLLRDGRAALRLVSAGEPAA